MIKVITYGTFDLLHYGHIRLLERAKALGDYLIVGITADDFDKQRGKINVKQPLMERLEAVRATGLADEIIVEEYEGQKIDDIRRFHVDIFTVGSDWEGTFDYLREYCKVVYLDRTQGISSSDIRCEQNSVCLGLVGELPLVNKFLSETKYVNGIHVGALYSEDTSELSADVCALPRLSFESLVDSVDALYIASHPNRHYEQIKYALSKGKHVLCESPIATNEAHCKELFLLAKEKNLVLFDFIKTAFSTAYGRLLLAIKSGKIGDVISVDATCTSLRHLDFSNTKTMAIAWSSILFWGPTAMLPIFQILGTSHKNLICAAKYAEQLNNFDVFSKFDFLYPHAVASGKVGNSVKSEGELIISGTKGYIYVPAPWWKTDYFELRYENPAENKRFFYQLDGEGIRNGIVSFLRSVHNKETCYEIEQSVSLAIAATINNFIKSDKQINIL